MSLKFWKMHGLGNDFVVIDARKDGYALTKAQVQKIADRRRGVGFDQLLVIEKSDKADIFMRILNADGSETGACGNGTRAVASLFMQETGRGSASIDTLGGILQASRQGDLISVDMGVPRLAAEDIPYVDNIETLSVNLGFDLPPVTLVNMGNPHCVFFVEDAEKIALAELGPKIETDPHFPERTNVEFCHIITPEKIRMRVWERGAGITEACGSGACASLVAAARRGLTGRKAEIVLDGGSLFIEWNSNDHVIMTGPASHAFEGVLSEELLG